MTVISHKIALDLIGSVTSPLLMVVVAEYGLIGRVIDFLTPFPFEGVLGVLVFSFLWSERGTASGINENNRS